MSKRNNNSARANPFSFGGRPPDTVQLKWTAEPSAELRVPVGKQVHVPCLAEGNPQPRIEWIRLNSNRNNNNNNNDGGGNQQPLGSELRFSQISQGDAGYYECHASNGVEEDLVARVKLEVLGK